MFIFVYLQGDLDVRVGGVQKKSFELGYGKGSPRTVLYGFRPGQVSCKGKEMGFLGVLQEGRYCVKWLG